VRVYRARLDGAARRRRGLARLAALRGRSIAAIVLVIVLLIVFASAAWYFYPTAQSPTHRLSVVVLPFANLSNDPEQEYCADAITNDLTTDLSRIDNSFVIAPSTALTYKGKAIDSKQIGRELGVRYILEGSLRRMGSQVRVNAQLIDAATGGAVWADRFEGDWTTMQVEDDITEWVARALDLELTFAQRSERPNDPDAVDLTMRARSILSQPPSRERLAQARDLYEQALRIDPQLPAALVGLGRTIAAEVNSRWSAAPAEQLAEADEAVTRVIAGFPNHATAHLVKGEIFRARKDFDAAIAEYETAIAINPSLAAAYASLGNAEIRAGRAGEAFAPLETAIRLSPRDPLLNVWYFYVCHAHTHLAQDEAAIEWCRRSIAVNPYWIANVDLASAYAWTGRDAEAHAAVAELRKLMPNYTVAKWANEGWSNNPVFLAQYQRIIDGLRKAGLPEN
jgi:TolB-like protein/cytochrome c-type biogenesis protein CcmH/NrfG